MKSMYILRISNDFPSVDRLASSQQGAPGRRLLKAGQAHVEPGLVSEIGASADEDHVAARAFDVDVPAGIVAGDPFGFARGQSDLAVDRQRQLQRDSGTTEPEAGQPSRNGAPRCIAADAKRDLDAGSAQALDSLPRCPWVGILERDDNPLRLCSEQ